MPLKPLQQLGSSLGSFEAPLFQVLSAESALVLVFLSQTLDLDPGEAILEQSWCNRNGTLQDRVVDGSGGCFHITHSLAQKSLAGHKMPDTNKEDVAFLVEPPDSGNMDMAAIVCKRFHQPKCMAHRGPWLLCYLQVFLMWKNFILKPVLRKIMKDRPTNDGTS